MVSEAVIRETVEQLLKDDSSYCDCRRSPFDKHTVNPPCQTRNEMTKTVRKVVELTTPHILGKV